MSAEFDNFLLCPEQLDTPKGNIGCSQSRNIVLSPICPQASPTYAASLKEEQKMVFCTGKSSPASITEFGFRPLNNALANRPMPNSAVRRRLTFTSGRKKHECQERSSSWVPYPSIGTTPTIGKELNNLQKMDNLKKSRKTST